MGPSNETEAEALERRKVEALEAIAKAVTDIQKQLADGFLEVLTRD